MLDEISNEMLHAILESIDEGIHVVDEYGVTIYYNQIAAKLDGVDVDEVLGKDLLAIFPSLTRQTSTLLKVIETSNGIYHQKQSYTNLRGKVIDTVNTTLPIKVGKKLVGAVEISKDISKIKRLSEKVVELQQQINTRSKTKQEVNKKQRENTFKIDDIITQDKQVNEIKTVALKASRTSSPIFVYGETGTGKELLVQSIHHASPRHAAPFIAQNCAAIPESLLEGILFGTTKGSFTGAIDRPGLFEIAHGGTLFLDEINSMPLELQAKLLRVLEDGEIRRIGSTKGQQFDVRVITAMNEEPEICIEKRQLRKDLFYRINVVSFTLPPLRKRKEDILLLTKHFINKFNVRFSINVTGLTEEATTIFYNHHWPGNIRELEHAIECGMNLVEGNVIEKIHLPQQLQIKNDTEQDVPATIPSLRKALSTYERELINQALTKTNGNILQAAKLLSIPRQTLQYKLAKGK
ncbi:sigma-54 interaction domain-containing protein [Bacillus sp. FJAT-45350]|uniref:sigma-54 interaction domain-containing protein n=1 Tax=Bacillus sp. FJAT-45350 TaxID=2011014 RepID=UPI00211D0171|nr:sigma 54-interacting transcriptional regulator [Bacillus sp. FJAT-45350]